MLLSILTGCLRASSRGDCPSTPLDGVARRRACALPTPTALLLVCSHSTRNIGKKSTILVRRLRNSRVLQEMGGYQLQQVSRGDESLCERQVLLSDASTLQGSCIRLRQTRVRRKSTTRASNAILRPEPTAVVAASACGATSLLSPFSFSSSLFLSPYHPACMIAISSGLSVIPGLPCCDRRKERKKTAKVCDVIPRIRRNPYPAKRHRYAAPRPSCQPGQPGQPKCCNSSIHGGPTPESRRFDTLAPVYAPQLSSICARRAKPGNPGALAADSGTGASIRARRGRRCQCRYRYLIVELFGRPHAAMILLSLFPVT